HAGCVEDEAWPIREILECRLSVKMALIRVDDAVADAAREEDSRENGWGVDRPRGHGAYRLDNEFVEVRGNALRVEREILPAKADYRGRDAATRHARDAIEFRKPATLVEVEKAAEVEEHGAVTAAAEAESRALDCWFSWFRDKCCHGRHSRGQSAPMRRR